MLMPLAYEGSSKECAKRYVLDASAQRGFMNGEVTPEQARKILDMLTQGGAMEDINTPLALRLIPLALELEDETLADRLLLHAKEYAADEIESGWATFETLKMTNASIDELSELTAKAELIEQGEPLSAAVAHHVALLHMANESYEEAQMLQVGPCGCAKQPMTQTALCTALLFWKHWLKNNSAMKLHSFMRHDGLNCS